MASDRRYSGYIDPKFNLKYVHVGTNTNLHKLLHLFWIEIYFEDKIYAVAKSDSKSDPEN